MIKNQTIKITLFYCSNSISAEEISYCKSRLEDVELNTISLPCSGKVNLLYILKTIETGSDGAILMTCRFGECKFIQGNLRASKRIEAVDDLLEETGLGRGHVKFVQLEGNNKTDFIINEIKNYSKQLDSGIKKVKEVVLDINK
jgi:F420-non-reducing hydrogenase iron-sulfur subunit